VSYSQCLGVIGYSLLPLTVIAAFLPLVHNQHLVSFFFKVFATFSAFLPQLGSKTNSVYYCKSLLVLTENFIVAFYMNFF